MSFFRKMFFNSLPLIFILYIIVFTYMGLPKTFFQQDEWGTFAADIYYRSKGIGGIIESFLPINPLSHFTPLSRAFSWYEHIFYGSNFTLFAWQSISLHILNTVLLYFFVLFWFKSKKIAFISALFFGTNSIPHQAVTWVAAANSYEIPTALILLSLIFFQRFLLYDRNRKLSLLLSFLALFVSLLFHENGIFLLLFYPIILALNKNKEKKRLSKTLFSGLAILVIIFVFIRFPFFFGLSTPIQNVTDISHPPIVVYPYRIISIGLKSFAGNFFPEKTLINISEEVMRLAYPQFITQDKVPNPFITQSIVFDSVSYALTIFLVFITFLFIRFIRQNAIAKGIIWSLIFIPTSLVPYVFVLGRAGYASILDPKFFYISSIGLSILIGLIFISLVNRFSKIKPLVTIIFILFGFYIFFHVHSIRIYIDNLQMISSERKNFLTTIKSSYENLPKNVVFFTKSDTSYYGMPDNEKILPVQIGFGKMLMIWYQQEEKFPGCLYEGQFLTLLLEEGYRTCDGRGFGYFRDYQKLIKSIKENNIPLENVISYSWNGRKEEFKDITGAISEKLKKDL